MTRGKRNLTYFGVAVLGAALGAALGLLVAPHSGRETRRRLNEESGDLVSRGQHLMDGVADYVQEALTEGRRTLTRVVNG